jgi:HSP20 family protein
LGRVSGRQLGAQLTQCDPAPDALPEGGDLLVRAELPVVKLENMEITLHAGVLTVSGERKAKEQAMGFGYLARERRHGGAFQRSVVLTHDVEEGGISARFESGVLEVRVPLGAAERGPKRIRIEGSSGEEGGDR